MPDTLHDLLAMAHGLARRFRVRGWDREDLAQEAYLAMAEAPPGCTVKQLFSRGRTRLSRIARREAGCACSPLPLQLEARPAGDGCDDVADLVRRVLPRREAALILNLYWLDMTAAEVAVRMGVSVQRVYQLRDQGLRRLAEVVLPQSAASSCC